MWRGSNYRLYNPIICNPVVVMVIISKVEYKKKKKNHVLKIL